jgi:conjugal transfer pilus assembly protein TraV
MKSSKSIFALLLISMMATGCSVVNPYEENFRCRTRDDAGKCIDTPSAYEEARNPPDMSFATCENNNGETVPCPEQKDSSNCLNSNGDSVPCSSDESIKVVMSPLQTNPNKLSAQNSRYKTLTELLDEPDKPMLEPPKIIRVLMLPYKGEGDELFMTRFVYLKLKESQWVLTDIREKATRGRR